MNENVVMDLTSFTKVINLNATKSLRNIRNLRNLATATGCNSGVMTSGGTAG